MTSNEVSSRYDRTVGSAIERPVAADLSESEFPSLPPRTKVVVWERECWVGRCDQTMTLWFVDQKGLWSLNRLEAHPRVIAAVRKHTAGRGVERSADAAPLAVLSEVVTRPAGLYLGFCCPKCGMVQGDFFNTKDMIARMKRGQVEIALTA